LLENKHSENFAITLAVNPLFQISSFECCFFMLFLASRKKF